MCLVGLLCSFYYYTMFVLGMLGIVLIGQQNAPKYIAKPCFDCYTVVTLILCKGLKFTVKK